MRAAWKEVYPQQRETIIKKRSENTNADIHKRGGFASRRALTPSLSRRARGRKKRGLKVCIIKTLITFII
jgi:hypothetical protein